MDLFQPVKVGIIGCGSACGAYVSGCRKFDILEITACADLEFYRAEIKAEQYKIPQACTVDELLADKKIQIVLNLTSPKAHTSVNLSALQAGKHIYSEKPFALDREQAQAVLQEAAARGLLVGAAPDTFLGSGLQTCRKLIDDGVIGEPIAAVAHMAHRGHEHWHPDPEFYYQKGGGPMFDAGLYHLTALVNLIGPINRVSGSVRTSFPERIITSEKKRHTRIAVEVATHFAGVLDFANGAICTLLMSFDVNAHHLPFLEIYGTKGALSVPDPSAFGGKVLLKNLRVEDWETVPLTHPPEVGRGIGVADLAYALTHDRAHRATGEMAYHILDAALALEESSRLGTHIRLESSCTKPAALPIGLAPDELDF